MTTITITTSEVAQPEKHWLAHVLLGQRKDLEIVFNWEHDHINLGYQLDCDNGHTLYLPDTFFPLSHKKGVEGWPFPRWPVELQNPFEKDSNVVGLYGVAVCTRREREVFCELDLFASAFFLLTRWEERLPGPRDKHHRFPASASFAFEYQLLHRPLVDEYVAFISAALALPEPDDRSFKLHFSCDVDHPRLWWNKFDPIRTQAGALLRGNINAWRWWSDYLKNAENDPYDVFDEWLSLLEQHNIKGHFNFMGERDQKSDAWYDLNHPEVQKTIHKIDSNGHIVGFHPSYEGWNDLEQFIQERKSLQQLVRQPVVTGRQHYLRFSVPETWQVWEDAGMEWDSSVGYPEAPGFRCGTCRDFQVFDLEERRPLAIREKPLIAMDVTLALYQGLSPEQGRQQLYELAETTKKFRGEMVVLWHNSSWNTYIWAPWKPVFRAFLEDYA